MLFLELTTRELILGELSRDNTKDAEEGSISSDRQGASSHDNSGKALSPVIIRNTKSRVVPNLTLNLNDQIGRGELYIIAACGILLQIGVVIYFGISAIYYKHVLLKDEKTVADYAFPCTVVGTLLLVSGMLVCAYVVEGSTKETTYRPRNGMEARIIWLQRPGTVNDQVFESFSIFPKRSQALVRTSVLAEESQLRIPTLGRARGNQSPRGSLSDCKDQKETKATTETSIEDEKTISTNLGGSDPTVAVMGTAVCLCGFFVQFIGLRGLHWSASIAQLGAIGVMTCIRAWVRRNLIQLPGCFRITPGHELDWLAINLAKDPRLESLWHMKGQQDKPTADDDWNWDVPDIQDPEQCEVLVGDVSKTMPKAHRLMTIRRNIGKLADWYGPASTEALCLARAIEIVMNTLFGDDTEKSFHWSIGSGDTKIQFRLERERQGSWKAFSDELEAALSLWLYSVYNSENSREEDNKSRRSVDDDAWLRDKGTAPKPCLRLLDSQSPALERDLDWWMPNGDTRIIKIQYEPSNEIEVQPHRKVEVQPHRIKGFASYSIGNNNLKEIPVKNLLYFESTTGTAADEAAHPENALNCILAAKSYQPLKIFYAHNLFSTFMWAVAKKLERPFHGRVEVRPADADSDGRDPTWQTFTLHNAEFSRMVQDIQSTGLGTLEEIYLSIIPPLSSQNKLPRADPIIQWTQKHALPHESMGHWEESASAYLWLFGKSQTFPKHDGISIKATALLMEQFRVVTECLKLITAQQFEDESISELNKVRIGILGRLKSVDQSILGKLMGLALRLDRDLKFKLVPTVPVLHKEDENELQFTNLHRFAFQGSHWEFISRSAGEDKNSRDILDGTPLHYAAARGDGDVVEILVGHRPQINAQDIRRETPLHIACRQNDAQIVRRLLQAGADTSIRDMDGRGPLHYAAAYGDKSVIQALVEAGADTNLLDTQGKTPLLWASYKGRHEAVECLWKTTHTELRDQIGTTPLHLALVGDAVDVKDILRVVKLLVNKPLTNVEARDRFGRTPLLVAAREGNEAVVKLLLKRGADKAAKNNAGKTPLHLAAEEGQTAVAWRLIRCGADVEAQDREGRTPLSLASWRGQEAVASLLIRHGATVEARDQRKRTPLHWAAVGGHKAVVWLLLFQGATPAPDGSVWSPLPLAAMEGHVSVVQLLLNWGADASGEAGNNALHSAIVEGSTQTVELLLDRGAALEGRYIIDGSTPLIAAARNCRKTLGELLLNRGAALEARDNNGCTALHMAIVYGPKQMVELLLDRGASLEAQDNSGYTALHLAIRGGQKHMVELLLDRGAVIEAPDIHGNTPLIAAAAWEHK